ncbi:hypothetical protein L218DRAFT_948831 [Marasmius fiardii PR-910]|nr:hypothetical protein L218DRAFT_948831 [Marasmius fiardii PR-910]
MVLGDSITDKSCLQGVTTNVNTDTLLGCYWWHRSFSHEVNWKERRPKGAYSYQRRTPPHQHGEGPYSDQSEGLPFRTNHCYYHISGGRSRIEMKDIDNALMSGKSECKYANLRLYRIKCTDFFDIYSKGNMFLRQLAPRILVCVPNAPEEIFLRFIKPFFVEGFGLFGFSFMNSDVGQARLTNFLHPYMILCIAHFFHECPSAIIRDNQNENGKTSSCSMSTFVISGIPIQSSADIYTFFKMFIGDL